MSGRAGDALNGEYALAAVVAAVAIGGCAISFKTLPSDTGSGGGGGGGSTGSSSSVSSTGGGGTCHDHKKNQGEGDVDCGGPCSAKCALGAACNDDGDCVAFKCMDGFCQHPQGDWTMLDIESPPGVGAPIAGFDGDAVRTLAGYVVDGTGQHPAATTYSYTFDGASWSLVTTQPKFPPRWGAATATFDGAMLVFGGEDSATSVLNDTWALSHVWKELKPSNPPPARAFAAMGASADVAVLFGGIGADGLPRDDTWELDIKGNAWKKIKVSAPDVPKGSVGAAMVYDAVRKVFVLFGGSDLDTTVYDETWLYDPSSHTWLVRDSSGPVGRYLAAMVFEPNRGRVVLTGGEPALEDDGTLGDTWEWDGKDWLRTAVDGPTRSMFGFAFDPAESRAVLVGGVDGGDIVAGTAIYRVVGNACSKGTECDTGFCVDGVCCRNKQCGTCSACNLPDSAGACAEVTNGSDPDSCPMGTCDDGGSCQP